MIEFDILFKDGESALFIGDSFEFENGFFLFYADGFLVTALSADLVDGVFEIDEEDDEDEDEDEEFDDEEFEDEDVEDNYLADLIKSIVVQELAERNAATVSASQPF